jgi:hypothetical protein
MPGVLAAEVPAVMGNGDVFETGAEIIGAAYSNLADMVAAWCAEAVGDMPPGGTMAQSPPIASFEVAWS